MINVTVSPELRAVCPEFVGACVEAQVINTPYNAELWQEIETLCEQFRRELTTETLKDIASIAATRRVYRACGKDPSRSATASAALMPTALWARG